MTETEYKSWARQFLKETPRRPQKLFLEIVELADSLKGEARTHHMESSFNSGDGLFLVKPIHVFHYPEIFKQKSCKFLINYGLILSQVEKINRALGAGFNLKTLDYLSSIPLSAGRKNDIIVFYIDFNLRSNRFDKVSLHINPHKLEHVLKIARFLRIAQSNIIEEKLQNLQFIGVDFYPGGECSLKTYQAVGSMPVSLGKETERVYHQINRFRQRRTNLLMTRFDNSTMPSAPDYIYFYCNGLSYARLLESPIPRYHKVFLKRVAAYINGFCINWVSFKDKKMEIYFR